MNATFLGIDPGQTGGLAVIDKAGQVLSVQAFNSDEDEFNPHTFSDMVMNVRMLDANNPTQIVAGLEKVHAMPGQGVTSMFKFGNTYGKIQGVLAAKHVPYELITPQAWTKVMLAGENKADGKNRSKTVVQRMYPHLDLRLSTRSRIIHSGMADALLIAEFLRRKTLGLLSVYPILAV